MFESHVCPDDDARAQTYQTHNMRNCIGLPDDGKPTRHFPEMGPCQLQPKSMSLSGLCLPVLTAAGNGQPDSKYPCAVGIRNICCIFPSPCTDLCICVVVFYVAVATVADAAMFCVPHPLNAS